MNLPNGFLRLTIIAFALVGVATVSAMILYGMSRPDTINWYLVPLVGLSFAIMLRPTEQCGGVSAITYLWNSPNTGPVKALVSASAYAIGGAAGGVWSIQNISIDADILAVIAVGTLPPVIAAIAAWLIGKVIGYTFGGFKA